MKAVFARIVLLVIGISFPTLAQNPAENKVRVGFYNLENLFDTVNDPAIQDEEFLPEGINNWSVERYQQKLKNMAKAISGFAPDILGVCELENRKVLEDLVTQPELAAKRYQIAHLDMDDLRGVDVALIYRPAVFKPFLIKKFKIKD